MKYLLLLIAIFISEAGYSNSGDKRYVFFLHNMFLELESIDAEHPEYGKCEYREIVNTFTKEGFTVISEIRSKNTDGKAYARKVVIQIDSLLKRNVKPGNITVVGTSKGGYIAMYVSSYLKRKDINYVFVGICSDGLLEEEKELNICGHVLSIYERSDKLGQSCEGFKARSTCSMPHYKEVVLNTGKKHGFLYKANDNWMAPAILWAKQRYNLK